MARSAPSYAESFAEFFISCPPSPYQTRPLGSRAVAPPSPSPGSGGGDKKKNAGQLSPPGAQRSRGHSTAEDVSNHNHVPYKVTASMQPQSFNCGKGTRE